MGVSSQHIVGGDHGDRQGSDFYPTPIQVTVALLDFIKPPAGTVVWEPACGDGREKAVWFWLPRSYTEINGDGTVTIPRWLAEDKGLV